MKHFLTILLFTIITFATSQAQSIKDSSNTKCGTSAIHDHLMATDSAYRKKNEDFENLMVALKQSSASGGGGTIYRIPVVVHVMHVGEPVGTGYNITDQQVKDGLNYLNQRYRKIAGGLGDGNGVDIGLEFALAVRDTNGNCTNGIVRYDMSGQANYVSNGVNRSGSSGISDPSLKALSRWNPTKYYNVYVVNEIDGLNGSCNCGHVSGYAYFASSHGSTVDGIIMLSDSYTNKTDVTFTHELGHAFNLYHTFEGDNNGTSCPTDVGVNTDYCGDTPLHIRYSSHPQFNTEANNCAYAGTNSCDAGTTQNHMHNYMDYSWAVCQNEFTADQQSRISTATTATRGSFLESNGNVSLLPPTTATVDFKASSEAICTGDSVTFIDESSCSPNTYINTPWPTITYLWTFNNGIDPPVTSTVQNPTITFNNNGVYDVTLQVTNSHGTTSTTKYDVFAVTGGATAACIPPVSANEGNFGNVVYNVAFNLLNNATSTSNNITYTDYTCNSSTIVRAGQTYSLSVNIRAGGSGKERLETYIDWNDNGTFEVGELVLKDSTNVNTSKTSTTNILIPGSAVQNKVLRMRVYGEAGTLSTNEKSCSSTMFIPDVEDYGVYILPPFAIPVANFSGANTTICVGNSIAFTDNSTNRPKQWSWTFGGGTPSSSIAKNPTITFNTPGTYSVQLVASNPAGSSSAMIKTLTVVGCAPVADFSATPRTACSGTSVSFTDLSTNLPTSWTWAFAGGTPSSSVSQNPAVAYNTAGTYQVQLIAMNSSGTNTATKSSYITINSAPVIAGEITGSTSECKNKTGLTYSIDPITNVTGYTWTVPADASITSGQGTNSILVSLGSTSGNIGVTSVNTCGSSDTKTTTVTINVCDSTPASIDAINNSTNSVVYPNPTTDIVFINLGKSITTPSVITLMDVRGTIIFQATDFTQQLLKIDMSNESAGIYILTVKNEYKMDVVKVVKQ